MCYCTYYNFLFVCLIIPFLGGGVSPKPKLWDTTSQMCYLINSNSNISSYLLCFIGQTFLMWDHKVFLSKSKHPKTGKNTKWAKRKFRFLFWGDVVLNLQSKLCRSVHADKFVIYMWTFIFHVLKRDIIVNISWRNVWDEMRKQISKDDFMCNVLFPHVRKS